MMTAATEHEVLFSKLARWTAIDAPVGFEEPVLRQAREELAQVCTDVELDVRGNLYAWQRSSQPDAPVVMITAHADEIGFMIASILPSGFLRFTRLGHPTEMVLPGQRIRLLTPSGGLEGVIGVKPGHVLSGSEARTVVPVDAMYMDVGATDAAEAARWGIEVGTPGVFVGPLTRSRRSGRVLGKAIDNRAGLLAVLEVARNLAEQPDCAAHRAFVITVEEEIGLRGAFVAAGHVQPDALIAIDTVPSGGTPDLSSDQLPWRIGEGPLLKVRETNGLSTHRPLRELMRAVAEAAALPYQLIVDTAGITDATSGQQAGGGIAAMVIGLPRRYSHTAVEMLDLTDLELTIDLVTRTVAAVKSREQLRRLP